MVKIAFFGNVANNFFRLGQILSSERDLEVTLFLPDLGDATNFPEGDLPDTKSVNLDWIDRGPQNQLRNAFRFGRKGLLWRLNSQDVVFLSSTNVMLAPLIRRPKVVFCPTGADMNVFPFFSVHFKFFKNSHSAKQTFHPGNLIRMYLVSLATRFGIKSCDYVLENPFPPYRRAAEAMKLSKSQLIKFPPPLAIDTETFRSRTLDQLTLSSVILGEFERFDFRVFSPSRILINNDPDYVRIGQYKRNDLLVEAFALFLKNGPDRRCGLFLVDRGTTASKETGKMKKLIRKLGIESHVVWLIPGNGDSFDRSSLIDMYSISDIVADDFVTGWFGSLSLEALSCGRPLLNYVDPVVMSQIYTWHPFLSSNDSSGVARMIRKIYEEPVEAHEIGVNGRRWVQEFHSAEPIKRRYSAVIQQIVEKQVQT